MPMTHALPGVQVLVVEDSYYLASDIQRALEAADATVIGPFGTEADAMRALAGREPDCAFVDVNLGNGPCFQVPRALIGRGVPFVFVTGYDASTIPDEFANVPRCEKPIDAPKIVETAVWLLRLERLAG